PVDCSYQKTAPTDLGLSAGLSLSLRSLGADGRSLYRAGPSPPFWPQSQSSEGRSHRQNTAELVREPKRHRAKPNDLSRPHLLRRLREIDDRATPLIMKSHGFHLPQLLPP